MHNTLKDENDYLPPVFSSPEKVGWAGALHPYIKPSIGGLIVGNWPYQCPFDATKRSESPSQRGFTDYWYNAHVMHKTLRGVTSTQISKESLPAQVVLVGCGGSKVLTSGFDATYNLCGDDTSLINSTQVCSAKIDVRTVFPSQLIHIEGDYGTNFLFADGHVKLLSRPRSSRSNGLNMEIK